MSSQRSRITRIAGIGVVTVPLLVVLAPAVLEPGYFAPLLGSSTGRLMFAGMIGLIIVGTVLVFLIVWYDDRRLNRGGKQRPAVVLLELLIPSILCMLPAIWIALIGPALIVVGGR